MTEGVPGPDAIHSQQSPSTRFGCFKAPLQSVKEPFSRARHLEISEKTHIPTQKSVIAKSKNMNGSSSIAHRTHMRRGAKTAKKKGGHYIFGFSVLLAESYTVRQIFCVGITGSRRPACLPAFRVSSKSTPKVMFWFWRCPPGSWWWRRTKKKQQTN